MNSPHHTRTQRSDLVAWLLAHPGVWAGYPVPGIKHAHRIFSAIQSEGLFAPRSQCNPKTITRLVADARAALVIVGTSNGTEMIKQ